MNNNVRKITDGAVMIALMGMALVLNRQFAGFLEIYFIWFLPIPISVYTAKHGYKNGLMVAFSVIFLSFIISTVTSVFYVISSCACGLVYGEGSRRGRENLWLLFITIITALIAEIFPIFVFSGIFGYNLAEEVIVMKDTIVEMLQISGISQSLIDASLVLLERVLPALIIAGVVFSAVLEGVILHLLSVFIFKRLKMPVKKMKPIIEVKIPKWIGYASLLLAVGLLLVFRIEVNEKLVGIISFFGTIGFLILASAGYIAFLLKMRGNGKKQQMIFAVMLLLVLLPYSLLFLSALGFLYITTDMRQKMLDQMKGGNEHVG